MCLNRVQNLLQLDFIFRILPAVRKPKALHPVVPDHRLIFIRADDVRTVILSVLYHVITPLNDELQTAIRFMNKTH